MSVVDFTDINKLHSEAMELAARADQARARGELTTANELIFAAFLKEREAALLLRDNVDIEPTRSVFLRSAASLAFECGQTREAEQLIGMGLSGNPPIEIADELRDLFQQVNLQRHFQIFSDDSSIGEIRMTLVGDVVGHGVIPASEYLRRVETVQMLLIRNHEYKHGNAFRPSGPPKREILQEYELLMTAPRAASFSVSFRYVAPTAQKLMPFALRIDELTNSFHYCMRLFRNGQRSRLKRHFNGNQSYLENFIALARQLAPDGKRIKNVGFEVGNDKTRPPIVLDSSAARSCIEQTKQDEFQEIRLISGILVEARGDDKNKIGVKTDDGITQKISVHPGLMNDIVRPLWDRRVEARVLETRGHFMLKDIRDVEMLENGDAAQER